MISRARNEQAPERDHELERRRVLHGLAAAGVTVPLAAACGNGGDGGGDTGGGYGGGYGGGEEQQPERPEQPEEQPGAGTGTRLGPTSQVPVGGGKVYPEQKIVVTQPTEGEFNAFSAICKHRGCLVREVESGTINCPCHGSKYDAETGAPVVGPNGQPPGVISALDRRQVRTKGGKLILP